MYEVFSKVYDEALAERFAPTARAELDAALAQHDPPGRRLVDLGCGSGILACALAGDGWTATGVDSSEPMLELARQRAGEQGCEVEWVCRDMVRFRREAAFDLALCLYDSLNHVMTNARLMRFFRNVHASLAPNGLLAFDVSNRLAYWNLWADPTPFERETASGRVRIHTTFDKANRVGEARVEVEQGGATHFETIRQRFFSDTEIEGLLQAERLELLERRDFQAFPEDDELRARAQRVSEEKGARAGREVGVWKDHPDPGKMKTFWLCQRKGS